ncbi:MAG: T9SS type A sorting domain-containing protein [Saprospiraceae bacterium]
MVLIGYVQLQAQKCVDCGDKKLRAELTIYPNPAVDYISLEDADNIVRYLAIYNLVGRRVKMLPASEDVRYPVSDLSTGMYLVQLLDSDSKVITTQRLSKR